MPATNSDEDPEAPLVIRWGVHAGGGLYHVIEGRRLNDAPLTRAQAEAVVQGMDQNIRPN